MPNIRKAVFPINGQGTFIYTDKNKSQFTIYVTPDKQKIKHEDDSADAMQTDEERFSTDNFISLNIGEHVARFCLKMKKTGEHETLEEDYDKNIGIESKEIVSYWFSYDRDALVLKYGKGHVMEETTLLTYDFLKDKSEKEREEIRKKYKMFFNAEEPKYVVVDSMNLEGSLITIQEKFQFRPNPLVCNFPAIVKDSSEVTLFDLDRDQYMFSSSLPAACQELYNNIKDLSMEYPKDPILKLSDAIRYSIETKGMTLYEKLKEKDPKFPYLRVTLGPDRRTAPGIPYVLEIWPKASGSPVHNHGGACAVIKNLYGRITVNIFNKFSEPPEFCKNDPLLKFDLKEGQITWIGPNWYQTHMLFNNTDDFCATVQCYRYDYSDTVHWPNFDFAGYVEGKDKYELQEFYPDSDFTFVHLRSVVLKEYRESLEK